MDNTNSFQPNLDERPQAKAYRKQVRIWIFLPLLLGILVIVLLIAMLWVNQAGSFSLWADITLIFILVPFFIMGMILLIVSAGLVYAIALLIGWIPQPAYQIEAALTRVDRLVRRYTRMIARPFMLPSAIAAAWMELVRSIASIFQKPH
jgi:hypothetical protein